MKIFSLVKRWDERLDAGLVRVFPRSAVFVAYCNETTRTGFSRSVNAAVIVVLMALISLAVWRIL